MLIASSNVILKFYRCLESVFKINKSQKVKLDRNNKILEK